MGQAYALKFKKVKPNEPRDIKISFREKERDDGYSFNGEGGVPAHGFFPGSEIGGDLHFSANENWSDQKTFFQPNLFAVAVDEIGHCLGLTHLQNADFVTHPTYKQEWSKPGVVK